MITRTLLLQPSILPGYFALYQIEQMFCPISRYASRFKKHNTMGKQNYHRDNSDIFTELSYTEHLKQEHNSSSLSVNIAKFAAKEEPELKMVHTSRHTSHKSYFHTSLHECALQVPTWVDGERGVRKQPGKREGENYSVLKACLCHNHNKVQTQSSTCDQVIISHMF